MANYRIEIKLENLDEPEDDRIDTRDFINIEEGKETARTVVDMIIKYANNIYKGESKNER
jgi:hypothetical protein